MTFQDVFGTNITIVAETMQKERRDDYQLCIELYVGETIQIARYIVDQGLPVDLSGMSLQFDVETKSKAPVASVSGDAITIFGDGNNGFRLTIPEAVTLEPRLLECALHNMSNGKEVLGRGQITVKYAPIAN